MTGLPTCTRVIPYGDADRREDGGPTCAGDDIITLDETARHRRRIRLRSDGGIDFLLDLAAARLLRDGDRLVLGDGRTIEVRAAAEALYEVRGRDSKAMLTLAWHIGNRHLPTQVMSDHLRIRADPVIGKMLEGLGAEVREVGAGFDPEGGAYGDAAGGHSRESPDGGHAHEH